MQADLEPDAVVAEAANFLINTPLAQRLRPTVPLLKERFGLDAERAIEAIRQAAKIRGGANADP